MAKMQAQDREEMLRSAPVGGLLFKLALPAVMAQLINVLYNMVDRIYIGNMPGTGALALTGLGVAFPIIVIITAFTSFAGSGGAPLASIQLGAGDKDKAERILGNSFAMLLFFSVVLTIFFSIFKEPILYAFGASDDTIVYSLQYLSIYLIGTIFVQIALGLNTFISAQGSAGTAMCSVVIGAVLNIILDPIFIFVFDMGVRGAALATILSQGVSAVWVLSFILGKKTLVRLRLKNMRLQKDIVLSIAALGVAPFIMQTTESLVSVVLNSGLQRYGGDLYVGSLTIMQSVMQMIIIPMQGLMQGALPIISYNFGAKNYARVRKAFWLYLKTAVFFGFVTSITAISFPTVLGRLFTQDETLLAILAQYMPIFFTGMTIFGLQMACQGAFMGMGQSKIGVFLALLRKVILLVPLALILPYLLGDVVGIYLAEPIADACSALTAITLFLINYKRLLPVGPDEQTK